MDSKAIRGQNKSETVDFEDIKQLKKNQTWGMLRKRARKYECKILN